MTVHQLKELMNPSTEWILWFFLYTMTLDSDHPKEGTIISAKEISPRRGQHENEKDP